MPATGPKHYPKSYRRKDAYRSVARAYAEVNLDQPVTYYDDTINIEWGDQNNYEVFRHLGKGKYGDVYEGIDLATNEVIVLKVMKPVKESRLLREVKILRIVSGYPYIVQLKDTVRDPDTKTPTFVFNYVEATDYRQLLKLLTDLDVKTYVFQLLTALNYCHSRGVMHRDVKPPNMLINHGRKQLTLIDWGLADFYFPRKSYPVRVATRYYKAPEVMCDIREYDYSFDLWAVGCTLGSMLFRIPVLFKGDDEFDQLAKVAKVLGTDELFSYVHKYGVELDPELGALVGRQPRRPWSDFVNEGNKTLASPEAFDLLTNLLRYDHEERLTAQEALAHPYFDEVRLRLSDFSL